MNGTLLIICALLLVNVHSYMPALEHCQWLDLTWSFNAQSIYWPAAKSFEHVDPNKNSAPNPYYQTYNYAASEHGGTHLDAPIHFAKNKRSVEQAALNADLQLSVSHLMDWESVHGSLHDCLVLMRTDWHKKYLDRTLYFGDKATSADNLHFPGPLPYQYQGDLNQTCLRCSGLHPEAAELLVKRGVKAFGLDTPSTDYGQSNTFSSHRVLAGSNIVGFENLMNVDKLPARGATILALPMKIAGGSGAPLRALAIGWDDDSCRRAPLR